MKNIKLIPFVLVVLAILLSACSGAATPATSAGGGKPQPSVVAFTGVIESIDGDQWIVNGQSIQVDLSAIKDGPFQAGDTVKVEARVEADGSVVALRVETPSAADLANDNSNASNSNDATNVNANEDNSVNGNTNADNSNDANANDTNSNDANNSGTGAGGKEVFGTVDAITDTSITVGGQTYQFAPGAEIKGAIVAGDFVKLHLIVNADGTLAVREGGLSDPSQAGNDNGNDDNGNDNNSNDDNGNDDDSNDDNGNDDHGNDSNDDKGNDNNSNGGNGNGG